MRRSNCFWSAPYAGCKGEDKGYEMQSREENGSIILATPERDEFGVAYVCERTLSLEVACSLRDELTEAIMSCKASDNQKPAFAKALGEVMTAIVENSQKELQGKTQEELEEYWHFRFDPQLSPEQNLYEFTDLIGLYSHHVERWEEHHHGSCCVVERVRDKYLMPKIRQFVADLRSQFDTEAQAEIARLKARIAALEEAREHEFARMLEWRGISRDMGDTPCKRCHGSGRAMYGSTATWRGGMGGQAITGDVCDQCWGSGNAEKPWTNLRQVASKGE